MKRLFYIVFATGIAFLGCKKTSSPGPDPQVEINKKMNAFVQKLESGSGKWVLINTDGVIYDSKGKETGYFSESINLNRYTWRFVHYNELNFEKLIYEIYDNETDQSNFITQNWILTSDKDKFKVTYPYWSTNVDLTFENIQDNSFDLAEGKPQIIAANDPAATYLVRTYHFKKVP